MKKEKTICGLLQTYAGWNEAIISGLIWVCLRTVLSCKNNNNNKKKKIRQGVTTLKLLERNHQNFVQNMEFRNEISTACGFRCK